MRVDIISSSDKNFMFLESSEKDEKIPYDISVPYNHLIKKAPEVDPIDPTPMVETIEPEPEHPPERTNPNGLSWLNGTSWGQKW